MIELFQIGFLSITLLDVIDIAIITGLFFWLYKALKDTVAVQILFGLVIIVGLTFITEAINLRSLNWILRTISDIWLLAFIILFQPELRRLLLMITRSPLFRIFIRYKIAETIDEIIEAAIDLSDKHIGALFVITRSQNVEMTVDTGVAINAMVSKELLVSIFNPKSALHDGAVIIDNQLIVSARCTMPLSSITKYEGRNLGTRHRAALGLSEQIDAIVIVISEETGSISIAESGYLRLDIPKTQLHSIINIKLNEKK